jgi:hypothetical protein
MLSVIATLDATAFFGAAAATGCVLADAIDVGQYDHLVFVIESRAGASWFNSSESRGLRLARAWVVAGLAIANGCVAETADDHSSDSKSETQAVPDCRPLLSQRRSVSEHSIDFDLETEEIPLSNCEELCGLPNVSEPSVLVGCVRDLATTSSGEWTAGDSSSGGGPRRGSVPLTCLWQVQCFPL